MRRSVDRPRAIRYLTQTERKRNQALSTFPDNTQSSLPGISAALQALGAIDDAARPTHIRDRYEASNGRQPPVGEGKMRKFRLTGVVVLRPKSRS